MLTPRYSHQYKKDLRAAERQHKPLDRLMEVLALLASRQPLPRSLRDHPLKGTWRGFRELHLAPDWLLVYRVEGDELLLAGLGSHDDLFGE